MQGSRASLMMQGLLPNQQLSYQELEELLVSGKVCEIRMLFYVGKDVMRWLEQCVGVAQKSQYLSDPDVRSFAAYLIEQTPDQVCEKLRQWGVQDFRSIFARAIGMNSIFAEAPGKEQLSDDFIRSYHFYADRLYQAWQDLHPYTKLAKGDFDFELYASAEFSRILERQWSDETLPLG